MTLFLLWPAFAFYAEDSSSVAPAAEAQDYKALKDLFKDTRQGGNAPTEQDLAARRKSGIELATRGREFLQKYPASSKTDDVRALTGMGLYEATMSGDSAAAKMLEEFSAQTVADPKVPESLKLHAFALGYLAQHAGTKGKGSLNQSSPEFQQAYTEAFLAAADVLKDKDSIFKMLLLQAKSGRELSDAAKRSIAERVLKHPAASAGIRAEAEQVLSGRSAYAIGKPLDISFKAVDGRKVDLQQMKGKVVLVDFWATWCGPCVGEVPNLKKTYDAFHPKGFEIIGISLDDKKSDLLEFTKKHDLPWPQHFDGQHWNNEISFRFGINSVPTQWLVDKKGILREVNARADLARAVERLLNED